MHPLLLALPLLTGLARARDPVAVTATTLNTWGLPYPVATVDRRDRFPRIERYIDKLDADLVGLQEVWRGARGLLDLGTRLYRQGELGDTGLALVSPHPVSEMEERPFRAARGVDTIKTKGVLSARVDIPEAGPVSVYVTHLQAGGGARNAAVRLAQVDELLAMVGEPERPAVLLGDFNFDPDQPADRAAARALDEAGLVDVAAAVGETRATHLGDGRRYDRVYVRGNRRITLRPHAARVDTTDKGQALSDHLPVTVEVAVDAWGPSPAPG